MLIIMFTGSLVGSVLGGRYSDYTYRKLKDEREGKGSPEVQFDPPSFDRCATSDHSDFWLPL